ncbi:MAG TPA: hypothetical protein VGE23_01815 [Candidatus Paceibacterota bacterium]
MPSWDWSKDNGHTEKHSTATDHHPKTGGGHVHDDHHGHGGGGLLKWGLAILVLGLVGWFLVWPWLKGLGFGQVPGASAEVRYAMAPQGTIPGRDARSASVVAYVRHPLRAPAKSQDWSGWISIPSGYRPLVCEADSSLACTDTESDVTKIGYVYQCQDLRGETHDWTPGACEHLVAFRVKAKSDRALNLAYWLEPF